MERALTWLVRIDTPLSTAALFAITRDAPDERVREAALDRLAEVARVKAGPRFAEACARLLLE